MATGLARVADGGRRSRCPGSPADRRWKQETACGEGLTGY